MKLSKNAGMNYLFAAIFKMDVIEIYELNLLSVSSIAQLDWVIYILSHLSILQHSQRKINSSNLS